MAKTFYTERDIEDMATRGQMSIEMSDDVVLTELAFEKAERLGVKLIQPHHLPPAAPIRPYLSQNGEGRLRACCGETEISETETDLRQRIRDSVNAKLGNQIDPALLETIITRVLSNIGIKV